MKKWDFALIALVAVLSLLPLAFLGRADSGARVVVSQNGQTLYTGALSEDAVFTTPDGGNTIEIRDGQVRMRAASCPDGLCLHGSAAPAARMPAARGHGRDHRHRGGRTA